MEVPREVLNIIAAQVRDSYCGSLEDYTNCRYEPPNLYIITFKMKKRGAANLWAKFILSCNKKIDDFLSLEDIFLLHRNSRISLNRLIKHGDIEFEYFLGSAVLQLSMSKKKLLEILYDTSANRCHHTQHIPTLSRKSVLLLCLFMKKADKNKKLPQFQINFHKKGSGGAILMSKHNNLCIYIHGRDICLYVHIDIYKRTEERTWISKYTGEEKSYTTYVYINGANLKERIIRGKCMIGNKAANAAIYLRLGYKSFQICKYGGGFVDVDGRKYWY